MADTGAPNPRQNEKTRWRHIIFVRAYSGLTETRAGLIQMRENTTETHYICQRVQKVDRKRAPDVRYSIVIRTDMSVRSIGKVVFRSVAHEVQPKYLFSIMYLAKN